MHSTATGQLVELRSFLVQDSLQSLDQKYCILLVKATSFLFDRRNLTLTPTRLMVLPMEQIVLDFRQGTRRTPNVALALILWDAAG